MSYPQHLFSEGPLNEFLESRKRTLKKKIESFEADRILKVKPEELAEELSSDYILMPPSLMWDRIEAEINEAEVDVRGDYSVHVDRGHPKFRGYVNGLKAKLLIPYKGNKILFNYEKSNYMLSRTQAVANDSNLVVSIMQPDHNRDELESKISQQRTLLKKWQDCVTQKINLYNESLKGLITTKIQERQVECKKNYSLIERLGLKVRKRDETQTRTVLSTKKEIKPMHSASKDLSSTKKEMSIEKYENILDTIKNMSLVMERNPASFKKIKEEDLRNHFLVQLNGPYKGQATGETFNYQGKTDILVRVDGKNIFIAECKFWGGEKGLKGTIDQILRYISWRDTKTAILLFNRNRSLSKVLEQIPKIVSRHKNFEKEEKYGSETGFRFTLHHNDDSDRKLILTILTFDVPQ